MLRMSPCLAPFRIRNAEQAVPARDKKRGRVFKHQLMLWIVALLLLLPLIGNAAQVVIVPSDNAVAYGEAEAALREKLTAYTSETLAPANLDRIAAGGDAKLIIAIGTKALQAALGSNNKIPVLAVLVTRKSFRQLTSAAAGSRQVSAVYIDQPLSRQLNLVRLVVPGKQRVGVLFSTESESELAELKRTTLAQKLTLVPEGVNAGDELPAALAKLLSASDVILAIPDPSIFNSGTIQNILFSAYRARKPLVSFSPYYVRAGAVAAVYSTPKQLAHQAAEMARHWFSSGVLAQPQYAHDFSVATNPTAARSLDLIIGDEKTIEDKLSSRNEGP